MTTVGLIPGSFDPFHNGHLEVVERASLIFDEIVRRIPDMHMTGEPQFLRSNFIGGIKHMPVAFTPGARINPARLAASTA